jgi:hypothetical protein
MANLQRQSRTVRFETGFDIILAKP